MHVRQLLSTAAFVATTHAFAPSGSIARTLLVGGGSIAARSLAVVGGAATAADMKLIDPKYREEQNNLAQYLVDLDDNDAVFDFCGGMMFQLRLSAQLRSKLAAAAAAGGDSRPVAFDAATDRMAKMPGYERNAFSDNKILFHGREVRSVPDAKGGHGFVLQLVDGAADDPEGWSKEEVAEYDGWGHDASRTWRKAARYESEGVRFQEQFGPEAFGLHHRCFLHLDRTNQLWLSAEDGCEGRLHSSA